MDCEEAIRISSILEAILQHVDSSEIKLRLNKCVAKDVKSWKDKNSLDLAHHCILENNIVALMLLLTRGYFKSPHEPSTWPYLHLVACLGRRTFISSIIQEVKYQNDSVILDWDVFNKVIKPRIKKCDVELNSEDKEKKMSPVDIAALFGHIGCVRLLLDFWQVQKICVSNKKSINQASLYLSLACQANSLCALQLLVGEHSDKKEALEYAMRMLAPDCVDSVLGDMGGNVQKAFHGMNLYHVLYSYSTCLTIEQYEAMVKITVILIKHKQDVNALQPSRTFPLYSLLSHTLSGISAEDGCPFLLACLEHLLKAGADPNMNEIEKEQKLQDPEHDTAFGRRPHSSAINCFLGNLQFLRSGAFDGFLVADPIDSFACDVIELLLKHHSDLNFTGRFNTAVSFEIESNTYHFGNALHLMLSTRTHNLISHAVVSFMLQNGLDADTAGIWYMPRSTFTFHYALNVLPFSLWSLPAVGRTQNRKSFFKQQDLQIFCYIMKFMSQPALVMAYREFLEGVQFLRQSAKLLGGLEVLDKSHLQESAIFAKIVSDYETEVTQPWSLQRCCSHAVWRACRMRVGNVHDLPIPGPLKNIVFNFH